MCVYLISVWWTRRKLQETQQFVKTWSENKSMNWFFFFNRTITTEGFNYEGTTKPDQYSFIIHDHWKLSSPEMLVCVHHCTQSTINKQQLECETEGNKFYQNTERRVSLFSVNRWRKWSSDELIVICCCCYLSDCSSLLQTERKPAESSQCFLWNQTRLELDWFNSDPLSISDVLWTLV